MGGGIVIKGTTVYHRRGDTGIILLDMLIDDTPFPLREGDKAVLTIKKNVRSSDFLLQKEAIDGYFIFLHEDTQDIPFGDYRYDVQVSLTEGQVITAVGPAVYKILPDITTVVKTT